MIIQETNGTFCQVRETGNPDLAHVWYGIDVKRVPGGWAPKKNAKERLVRKAAARIVRHFSGEA